MAMLLQLKLIIQRCLHEMSRLFPYIDHFIGQFLGSPRCALTLLHKDFLDPKCSTLFSSKVLGWGMVCLSSLYKVPVIRKILYKKSGDGYSLPSCYLETSAYVATLSYNYLQGNPVSTYGDLLMSSLQNVIIILLIYKYGQSGKKISFRHKALFVTISMGFLASIFVAPPERHPYIASYGILVLVLSRLPQIISNMRTGNIGVQSAITTTNSVLGAGAKAFINITETKNMLLVTGALVAFALNFILLLQILLMRPPESGAGGLEGGVGVKNVPGTANKFMGNQQSERKNNENLADKKREEENEVLLVPSANMKGGSSGIRRR